MPKVRLLTLEWLSDSEGFFPERVVTLLRFLRDNYPEIMPVQFGLYEDLDQSFIGEADQEFLKTCEAALADLSGMVFWSSTSNLDHCALHFSTNQVLRLNGDRDCVSVKCSFDCANLNNHADIDHVVALFTDLSKALECFYARGFVTRGVEVVDGLVYEVSGDRTSFGSSTQWRGIPDVEVWLTWFGDENIRQRVAEYLDPKYLACDGKLMRLGEFPLDAAQLRDIYPNLPESVLNLDSGAWTMAPFNTGKK